MLSEADRSTLLKIAREAIAAVAARKPPPPLDPDSLSPALLEPQASFVTLTTGDGELRGCIGGLEARFPLARQFLALALGELGRHDAARREIDAALDISDDGPEIVATAGYLLARAGDVPAARARLDELIARSGSRYVSPVLIAQVHAGLGHRDEALSWLARALDMRAADLAWLAVRPVFDTLRDDPGFQTLRARTGLAPGRED